MSSKIFFKSFGKKANLGLHELYCPFLDILNLFVVFSSSFCVFMLRSWRSHCCGLATRTGDDIEESEEHEESEDEQPCMDHRHLGRSCPSSLLSPGASRAPHRSWASRRRFQQGAKSWSAGKNPNCRTSS